MRDQTTTPPDESALRSRYAGADLLDAFAIPLPRCATSDIRRLAEATLAYPSRTFRALLGLRDLLVLPLGLQTSRRLRRESRPDEQRFFIFKVLETHRDELIVGGDASHLAFRMSVLIRPRPDGERDLVLTSVVHCRNMTGRIYLAVIRPFHVVLVRSFLRRADVRGWPSEPSVIPCRATLAAADARR